jgi:hypothetical protein
LRPRCDVHHKKSLFSRTIPHGAQESGPVEPAIRLPPRSLRCGSSRQWPWPAPTSKTAATSCSSRAQASASQTHASTQSVVVAGALANKMARTAWALLAHGAHIGRLRLWMRRKESCDGKMRLRPRVLELAGVMTTLMRNGRDCRSRKTRDGSREERTRGFDWDRSADHIRASSQDGCIQRPDTWLHPNASRKRQILLLHRGRRRFAAVQQYGAMRGEPDTSRASPIRRPRFASGAVICSRRHLTALGLLIAQARSLHVKRCKHKVLAMTWRSSARAKFDPSWLKGRSY